MKKSIEWHLWSAEQIVDLLPDLIGKVESHLGDFPEEHREKNRTAVESLRANPPAATQVRDGSRSWDVVTVGFALDILGRLAARDGNVDDSLRLFQAAHEIFRGGNPSLRPTKPMRQTLGNALKVIVLHEVARAVAGETDAGIIRDELKAFVISAWGVIPPQLALGINEMILTELERARAAGEDDAMFQERFVRDNIEVVLAMEVPTRLEKVRERWEEIGEHVAPAAARMAKRTLRRPEDLSVLLPKTVWAKIQQAVEQGDAEGLGHALAEVEDALETNLRLRLDAKAEYREPIFELRFKGGPDRFFVEARELLLRRDSRALQKFNNIHFRNSTNPIAKEWYAYALSLFGRPTDIHDIIELLEDAIASEYYRPDLGWTARWNLACALRRLPPRAGEALDVLLPVLENDAHTSEVSELCLLWALEQGREDVLASLFVKSPYYEAHLLAALQDAEALTEGGDRSGFRDHFRRINRILRDPDRVFPDPKERLSFADLDQLTRDFIETSLVAAGVEWFRQRVSYGNEQSVFKNWECAAMLNEEAGNLQAAWRCRQHGWKCTQRNRNVDRDKKTRILRSLLNWAQRNGFEEDALRIVKQSWRDTSMSDADARVWEQRLRTGPPPTGEPEESPKTAGARDVGPKAPPGVPSTTPEETERIIQQVAGSFMGIGSPDALAVKAADVERLLAATSFKHPEISPDAVGAIREVVRLAFTFHGGVDEQQGQALAERLKDQLVALRRHRQDLPFELHGLAQACERVIQNVAVRVKAVAEVIITPPAALKVAFDRPASGETYSTRAFARLANPGAEDMRNLKVVFMTPSPSIRFLDEAVPITALRPGEKRIIDCSVEVTDGAEDEVDIRVHVTYEIGGVQRTTHASGRVPIRLVGDPIPVALRYVTSAPVGVDRSDLFHGRDKELSDLLAAFAGSRLLKLYFVNGIRAVGKSTLMQHLAARCGPEVLVLLLNIETALGGQKMNAVQLVRQLIRESIRQMEAIQGLPRLSLALPGSDAFDLDPPWFVFDAFIEDLKRQTQRRSVLICFDEMQRLVKRIADPDDPMGDGFLSWLRAKIQTGSDVFVVCTGSEPYAVMRKRYEHTLWRNMEAYDISFVEKAAMEKIATLPVRPDGIIWLPEALEPLWDMTEGHPWIIQILAEKVTERLNAERRRLVGPTDVDRAAELAALDSRISDLWWNEKEGLVTATHRQIAFLILQNQPGSRLGLPESQLAEACQKGGIRTIGKYLDEMRALEVLTEVKDESGSRWRIRGAFLERHLMRLMQRAMQEVGAKPHAHLPNQPLALMLDWENVKISLGTLLKEMPEAKAQTLRSRLTGAELATRLLDAASRHGSPRQRWAVADWDRPGFEGDQKAVKSVRYWTDIAGSEKSNASDHVLREKIHFVLREHPEISVYIIGTGDGDFHEAIKTLQEQGKHVILWSTRRSINQVYGESLKGPDRIQIEWLEDQVFGEESAS